jgi:hypothetical protein
MPASIRCNAPTSPGPLVACPVCQGTTWWRDTATPGMATCQRCGPATPMRGRTIQLVEYGRYDWQPVVISTLADA